MLANFRVARQLFINLLVVNSCVLVLSLWPATAVSQTILLHRNEGEAVLYTTIRQLTSTSGAQLLHLTILDRGANALLQWRRRYLACVSYDTKGGEYTSNRYPFLEHPCLNQPKQVAVSVLLDDLGYNDVSVNAIVTAFKPENLDRIMGIDWQQHARAVAVTVARENQLIRRVDSLVALSQVGPTVADLATTQNSLTAATTQANTALFVYERNVVPAAPLPAGSSNILSLTQADDLTNLQNLFNTIYIDFQKENKVDDTTPVAGVTQVRQVVRVKKSGRGTSLISKVWQFMRREKMRARIDENVQNADSVLFFPDVVRFSMEDGSMEDGSMEEILVTGHLSNGSIARYGSYIPIGMSSDNDLRRLWPRQRLFAFNYNDPTFIKLTDVLDYAPNIEANGKDRSPADGTYVLHPGDGLRDRLLPRLAQARILQGRIYSDLVGFGGDRPNGLVQVEISQKFNWRPRWSSQATRVQFRSPAYLYPLVAFTKIE